MLSPFICGSFRNQEEEENDQWSGSHVSAPRKSRKSSSIKNPYSARGLDKFSELVADLEKRKQEIHSKVGPEDMYVVRFKYSNSNHCVPLVIKLKDHYQEKAEIKGNKPTIQGREVLDKLPKDFARAPEDELMQQRLVEEDRKNEEKKKKKKISMRKNLKLHRLRRPSYYAPAFVILILVLLLFFGRPVTILCTSLGWYMVPTIGSKRPRKEKSHRRGSSQTKMVSDGLRSSMIKNNAIEKSKSF